MPFVVRVVVRFAGDVRDHREAARHGQAVGPEHRVEVRPEPLRPVAVAGERLAADAYVQASLARVGDLHPGAACSTGLDAVAPELARRERFFDPHYTARAIDLGRPAGARLVNERQCAGLRR